MKKYSARVEENSVHAVRQKHARKDVVKRTITLTVGGNSKSSSEERVRVCHTPFFMKKNNDIQHLNP